LTGAFAPPCSGAQPIRFSQLSLADGLSQNTVLAIFQDARGFMWFGTEDGLNRYDGYTFTVYRHDRGDPDSLPDAAIWAIAGDRAGDVWVGTESGDVARWNRQTDRFLRYPLGLDAGRSGSAPSIRALHVDREDHLWIGTRGAGLARLSLRSGQLTHFRHDPADRNGIPSDGVYAVSEDRAGGIWIGTDRGLCRLGPPDRTFSCYSHDPRDPFSLSDDGVRVIHQDRDGALWIGTAKGGLNRLELPGTRFVHYRHDSSDEDSLSDDSVRAVLEDATGRLWVGTGRGLNLLDSRRNTFVRYLHHRGNRAGLSNDDIFSLFQDRGEILWVGTRTGGLNKWNPRTWSFGYQGVAPGTEGGGVVSAFSVDSRGRLWIGTFGDGLVAQERTSGRVNVYRNDPADPRSLTDNRVMALLHDREGTLWVGTKGGLNRLDERTGTFTAHRAAREQPGRLRSDGIVALFEDSRGMLWVGTHRGGLSRLDRAQGSFTTYRHEPADAGSLSGDFVTCFAEDSQGNLWVGTDGGGLNRFDRRRGTFTSFRNDPLDVESLSSNTIFSLYADPEDLLWVGTRGGGLDRMQIPRESEAPPTFKNYSLRDGLANAVVYGIQPDGIGALWLSTNYGLSRFEPTTEIFTNYDVNHGLQSNEFNFGAHARSPTGELFFGGIEGFNAFIPERLRPNNHVPDTVLTSVLKFNEPFDPGRPAPELRHLTLGYRDDVVTFEFAGLDFAAPERNRYSYTLEGFDHGWIPLGNLRRATYTNLDAGNYVFRVRAANNDGIWNSDGLALSVSVLPPPWLTWWAYAAYGLAAIWGLRTLIQALHRRVEKEHARKLERELKRAIERNELQLYYQPILSLGTGTLMRAEALVRWPHPQRGLLGPAHFIPLAEQSGLIVPLGVWVLRAACEQVMAWRRAGLPPVPVAVNFSLRQLQQPDLALTVGQVLEDTGLEAGYLVIEVTESAAMHDKAAAIKVFTQLKQLGVGIALDDFGSEYSSLNHLKTIPVDELKIDRSFIVDLATDPHEAAIVRTILALAESLSLTVVAEGVETREQLELLRQLKVHAVQGYLLGPPVPTWDLEARLRRRSGMGSRIPEWEVAV
jgi:EAL domain-containing protein (putative c-di-GMP-specific phosphodiesterase class I)/ligand-binding sensor domain-containing protein